MKLLIPLFLILILNTLSGSNNKMREMLEKSPGLDTIEPKTDQLPLAKLPFGCPILFVHKFPRSWDIPLDDNDSVETKINPEQAALQNVEDYYEELVNVKSGKSPMIKISKYIKVGYDKQLLGYESKFHADFKYRLPSVGPYECYYQYFNVPMDYYYKLEAKHHQDRLFTEFGNLVLYNRSNKEAKFINIYNSYSYGGELTLGFVRFFYIDTAYKIKIFESEGEETSETIRQTYEIRITAEGRILIKAIN